ncbi:MAG: helix-turn-helix transcriptional regulator [Oscillospiraceae bacterium]|nr:helix-turn-helix transcriptional regulator [Oscillospiraceae bacterium]
MDAVFIRDRITELRLKKGVSEYQMSLDLGHSKGYVQSISCGRALPSMTEFLYICEYLGVRPDQFFETAGSEAPAFVNELTALAAGLKGEDLSLLLELARRLAGGN